MSSVHIRVLVIGFGDRVRRVLLPALREASVPAQVTAICDPHPSSRHHVLNLIEKGLLRSGIRLYADLDSALEAGQYDVALVACPHDLHYPITLRLAEHGITVWKEKPFALDIQEALELRTRVSDLRILAHRPHGQLYRIAEALLPSWGRLLSYRISIARQSSDYSDTWRASRQRSGGGAIIDLGYHAADLIARFAPQAATVYAVSGTSPAHRARVEVEETAHLILTHAGDCTGTVYLSRCDDHADDIDLIAERGRITITSNTACIQVAGRGGSTDIVEMAAEHDPQARMLRFHVETHTDDAVTARELAIGVKATALIQAAYASMDTTKPAPVISLQS